MSGRSACRNGSWTSRQCSLRWAIWSACACGQRARNDLARSFLARCPQAQADHIAHLSEHCLEVQLPFLHALRPDIQILPIVLGFRNLETCLAVGSALAAVIQAALAPPLLIASTDLTHCGPGFGQSPPPGLTAEA